MQPHLRYLAYVLRHKWHVFIACRGLHVPLWQAIIHDWTKFLPCEWFPCVQRFYPAAQVIGCALASALLPDPCT